MKDNVYLIHGGDISQPSGGTNRVTCFAKALAENGADVTLVVPKPSSTVPDQLTDVDIADVQIRRRGVVDQPLRAILLSQYAMRLAEDEAQLQIAHSSLAGVSTLFGASGYILDMHDLIYPQDLYGDLVFGGVLQQGIRWLERRAVKRAQHVIVVSESLRQVISEQWDISPARITVIPNGYDPMVVPPAHKQDRIPGRVVFLGELHDKVDLRALRDITQLRETEELVIIGKGDYYDALRSELDSVSETSVTMTGWLPPRDAFELAASATVAVAPYHRSLQYGMSSPVKLYAYAGLGLPIVVSEGPDIANELTNHGAAVQVKNNEQFAAQVQRILSDPGLQQRLSKNAVSLADEFLWAKRGAKLSAVYRSLTHTHPDTMLRKLG